MILDLSLPIATAEAFKNADHAAIAASFLLSDLSAIPLADYAGPHQRSSIALPVTTTELLNLGIPVAVFRRKLEWYIDQRLGGKRSRESVLAERWANQQKPLWGNYISEVRVSTGRIDLVFPSEKAIIEAKFTKGWKSALGQVLAYREVYRPGFRAGLLLLGESADRQLIESVCARFQVSVYWFNY